MANATTQRTLLGSGSDKTIVRLINIVSDGSEETDLVIYDNSTLVADVTKGRLVEIWASGSSCQVLLEWDQTTDSPVFTLDPANGNYWDFRSFGGIDNPAGTGATGDLLLTTTNLDAGDVLTIIIKIAQN
jgi:adhesin HecA-like repeat protein